MQLTFPDSLQGYLYGKIKAEGLIWTSLSPVCVLEGVCSGVPWQGGSQGQLNSPKARRKREIFLEIL